MEDEATKKKKGKDAATLDPSWDDFYPLLDDLESSQQSSTNKASARDTSPQKQGNRFTDWLKDTFRIASDEELIANSQERSGRSHIENNTTARFDTMGDVYKEIGLKVSTNKDSIRAERGVAEAMKFAGDLNKMPDEEFLAMRAEQGITPREIQQSNPEAMQEWISREKGKLRHEKAEELTKQYGNSARDSVKGNAALKGTLAGIAGGVGAGTAGGLYGIGKGLVHSYQNHGLIAGTVMALPYMAVEGTKGLLKRGFQGAMVSGTAGAAYGANKAMKSGTGAKDYANVMLNAMNLADERHVEDMRQPNKGQAVNVNENIIVDPDSDITVEEALARVNAERAARKQGTPSMAASEPTNPYEAIIAEELDGKAPAPGTTTKTDPAAQGKIETLKEAFGLKDDQMAAIESARQTIDASQETARAQYEAEGAKIIPLNPHKSQSQSRA